MFLHGWGGDERSFCGLAEVLSREFCVTLVDFYGFGKTPHPDFPLSLDDYCNSVVALISHYKMKNVILIGHSFGGRVALRLARQKGYLFDRIVLIGSAGLKPRRGLKYHFRVLRYKFNRRMGRTVCDAGSADYRALQGAMKKTFVNIVNEDQKSDLPFITLPVLLIWGANDAETPLYMAKRMRRLLPASTLHVLPEAGHYVYLERPFETLGLIKDFIGGETECL